MRTPYLHAKMPFALLMAVLLAGCLGGGEGASPRAAVYKAKGKVTYLGNPLIGASVSFSPQGKQPAAVGRTNDDGEFSLTTYRAGDGAAEGEYKVMITMTESEAATEAPAAHGTDAGKDYGGSSAHGAKKGRASSNILPAIFSDAQKTPLTVKVEPSGKNEFPFDLK